MDIGNFEDFMATLTPEVITGIIGDASKKAASIADKMSPLSPAYLGTQIGAVSFTISLELLGVYHKWLEEQH